MPFSKEKNHRIYITALIISFLLIVGSIYLHLRQKTHLGRMSFNLERDRIKPTSGVDTTTWVDKTTEYLNSRENIREVKDISEISAEHKNVIQHGSGIALNEDKNESSYADVEDDVDAIIDSIAGEYHKQESEYETRSLPQDTAACLRCICMTINECRPTHCGSRNPCGLYLISKSYWIDAGRPTIAGGSTYNEDQDYLTCVNEDTCAATAIRQYYNRFKRDCNKDGLFNCRDQIALHILGPSGCLTKNLGFAQTNRMRNCLIESNLDYLTYTSGEDF